MPIRPVSSLQLSRLRIQESMNHANRTNAERFNTNRDANIFFKLSTWAWKLFPCRFFPHVSMLRDTLHFIAVYIDRYIGLLYSFFHFFIWFRIILHVRYILCLISIKLSEILLIIYAVPLNRAYCQAFRKFKIIALKCIMIMHFKVMTK